MVLVTLLLCCAHVVAQEQVKTNNTQSGVEVESDMAPVEVDGVELFQVRGVPAFPAEVRARGIAERIRGVAANQGFSPNDIQAVDVEYGTGIFAGNQRLMIVSDADVTIPQLSRKALADLFVTKIRGAINDYRQSRSREVLLSGVTRTAVATLILIVALVILRTLFKRIYRFLEGRYRKRIHAVGIQSFQVVRAEQIWTALQRVLNAGKFLVLAAAILIYLHYALSKFPWTRPTAQRLGGYLLSPLQTMGNGLLAQIPSIIFLIILFLITRFFLRLIHKFFGALKTGDVKLSGFDAEWSESTYKLIRLAVVVLALVVAYPYIPGGNSEAFKGITIFIGIVFSLGSSSAIANLIAGYTMTYRRAFRIGDRIKIGTIMGDVIEMRLQVTHLKTVKNEEVIIPNSNILNNEVINYSSLARERGLILYTSVGIGYETPWRQVEAMLLKAADITPGFQKEPPPFVNQKKLGDFAVTYELNVYCDTPKTMARVYTALHQNILDIFNEFGVQIMTPAYETDPAAPKVVPKEKWFDAPARAAQSSPV
jgi:small-conductance mechanosensitive channel